jgi:hypothetical protein
MESKKTVTIIPAQLGWSLIGVTVGFGESAAIYEEPIIAWRIVSGSVRGENIYPAVWPQPITAGGLPHEDPETALVQPDGRVMKPGTQAWPSRVSFRDWVLSQRRVKSSQECKTNMNARMS